MSSACFVIQVYKKLTCKHADVLKRVFHICQLELQTIRYYMHVTN